MRETFPPLIALLFAYAMTFGVQNKAPFLYWFRRLHGFLACTYCVGFHAGWVTWLLAWAVTGTLPATGWGILPSVAVWSLTSAAFSFAFDALVRYLEVNAVPRGGERGDDGD